MRTVLLLAVIGCSSETSTPSDGGGTMDSPAQQGMDVQQPPVDSGMDAAADVYVDPCKDRTICEDFEKDLSKWKVLQSKGTATIDTMKSFGGKQSLKVAIEAFVARSVL